MSEQPTTPAAPAPEAPAAPAAPAPAPAPTEPPAAPQQPAQEPQQGAEWDGKVESLPEPVQKMIRDLRSEAADKRTKLTAAEQAQQDAIRTLAKAAGIELPGEEAAAPKPEQLAQQLTETQTRARQAQVDLAVYQNASHKDIQGDPVALLDSRTFQAKVASLDPTAEDFQSKLIDAMKAAVADNPKLKAVRAAGQSSVDHAGGSGEQRTRTPLPLDQAVRASYGA